jgi:ATP-dependent Clp protease adaptor protein ClpS
MTVDADIIVDVETVNINKIKEPSKFKVIVYNDDLTTMEFVIALLMAVFRHSEAAAVELTRTIHNEGSAVAGIYTHEIAEQKVIEATEMSELNGFPLVIRMLPE